MNHTPPGRLNTSHWIVAGMGLLWNLFGIVRFMTTEFADKAQLIAAGMTPAQAAIYLDLPLFMKPAFAVGVFGGAIGCVLLLMRRGQAAPVFWASLIGYAILYLGDAVRGIFAAFGPPQIIVLTLVLAIAAALLWYARRMARHGALAG